MNKSNIDVMLKEINNLLIQIQEKKNKIKECIEPKVIVASVDDIRKMFNVG